MNAPEAAKGALEGGTVIAIIPVILTTESIFRKINPRQNLSRGTVLFYTSFITPRRILTFLSNTVYPKPDSS